MKRSIVSLVLILVVVSGIVSCKNEDAEKKFEVKGTIKNAMSFKVFLEEVNQPTLLPIIVDSSEIGTDGAFVLKTKSAQQKLYGLRLQKSMTSFLTLVNDAPSVKVNVDFGNKSGLYTVEGSESSKKIKEITSIYPSKWNNLYRIRRQYDSVTNAKGSDSIIAKLNEDGTNAFAEMKNGIYQYLKESKSPAFSMYLLQNFQNIFTVEEYMASLDSSMKRFPGSDILIRAKNVLDEKIAAAKEKQSKSIVGQQAPEIALPDVNGKQIKLSSFRGKYVLVDFWASWCGPCRAENPNVVSAYNKFKNKNFTILGVSLDRPDGKKNWLKAIKDDKLSWTHVSDLKFWNSEVVPVYRIEAIPYNVLVDPEGKVIAEKLRGIDLEAKLSEFLK